MSLITDLLERPFDQAITSKYTAMAIAGVFPHFLLAFAVLDPTLGIGVWLLLSRSDRSRLHSTAGRYAIAGAWNRGATARSPASADIAARGLEIELAGRAPAN
jgi:hypothetical protein